MVIVILILDRWYSLCAHVYRASGFVSARVHIAVIFSLDIIVSSVSVSRTTVPDTTIGSDGERSFVPIRSSGSLVSEVSGNMLAKAVCPKRT